MGSTGKPEAAREVVVMRYYVNSELEPTTLKVALENVKNVSKVEIKTATRKVLVTWQGDCKTLNTLETAAATSGTPAVIMSHVHVLAAFKAQKGASLERLNKELLALKGMKGVLQAGIAAEFHADLGELTVDAIREAAKSANFELQLKSHQWVRVKLAEGDAARYKAELNLVRGILSAESTEEGVCFWAAKAVTDSILKKLAESNGMKVASIERS